MTGQRYVVLGLASVRAVWPREVTGWAMAGALPIEFIKCVSVEEVRARLRSGRRHSAVLVDSAAIGVDRDLLAAISEVDAATIVIGSDDRDWIELGAQARLHEVFSRQDLLDRLTTNAAPLGEVIEDNQQVFPDAGPVAFRGHLIAVTGRTGSGVSTLAIALAQAYGADSATAEQTILADLALHGDQALLHDATDIVPGIQELTDGHRSTTMMATQIRQLAYSVPKRRYDLLLGLRRHRDWVAIRPRAFAAALDGLLRTYRMVVADVTADVEGEVQTGSIDVEDRNSMARTTLEAADLVVAVGTPDLIGTHGLVQTIDGLVGLGIDTQRITPVFNTSPRSKRARADAATALAELADSNDELRSPLFLPHSKHLDDVHRNGTTLSSSLTKPLHQAIAAVLQEVDPRDADLLAGATPRPVKVGSLGQLHEADRGEAAS